ncbi:hypothetical protein DL546_006586 [Coniochaeta pulveracea]|uniref:Secreted protein n=1 Tax=Coniochaeta pulveracea TaxID=177199 RepID=A0A420YBP1_9PEZI|nr:hypothetical protein DL546_006586 [Coniochaeta pulveracea]
MHTVSLAAALAALSSTMVMADSPDPSPAVSTSLSGNGCPQGSASGSDTSFTFTRFSANAADGSTRQTLNCEAHSNVSGSGAGWQVAVSTVDAKGHVTLDPGARLDYYTTTFFSQNADVSGTTHGVITNNGATTLDTPITIHQVIPANKLVYSPCSTSSGYAGISNVNFRIALSNSNGAANAQIYNEQLSYTWRRC